MANKQETNPAKSTAVSSLDGIGGEDTRRVQMDVVYTMTGENVFTASITTKYGRQWDDNFSMAVDRHSS